MLLAKPQTWFNLTRLSMCPTWKSVRIRSSSPVSRLTSMWRFWNRNQVLNFPDRWPCTGREWQVEKEEKHCNCCHAITLWPTDDGGFRSYHYESNDKSNFAVLTKPSSSQGQVVEVLGSVTLANGRKFNLRPCGGQGQVHERCDWIISYLKGCNSQRFGLNSKACPKRIRQMNRHRERPLFHRQRLQPLTGCQWRFPSWSTTHRLYRMYRESETEMNKSISI